MSCRDESAGILVYYMFRALYNVVIGMINGGEEEESFSNAFRVLYIYACAADGAH